MLSASNKLCLLEVNTNPALSRDNSTLEQLLPGVVDGCIELVLRLQGPDRRIISDISNSLSTGAAGSTGKAATSSFGSGKSPDRKTVAADKSSGVRRDFDYSQFKDQLNEEDSELLKDLPGRYQLIYNESTGFEFHL